MSIFHIIHIISRVYMSFFGEQTNNFVLLLLDSIIIDIFSLRRDDFTVSGLLQQVRCEEQSDVVISCLCGSIMRSPHSLRSFVMNFTRCAYHLRQTRLVNYPG